MKQELNNNFRLNEQGNPTGGVTTGTGITILWQDGPLGRDGNRLEPNGAFVEGVIQAAVDRLEFFEKSKFACEYNKEAIRHLNLALGALEARTEDREDRQVEGTHQV